MTTTDQPSPTCFSQALRGATWGDHQQAEHAPFVSALMRGELDLDAYADLVDQHWHLYRVLEDAAATMALDPVAGAFVHPELTRRPALEQDLAALRGPNWPDRSDPAPTTLEYCARLESTCFTWPGGFVAHHYTRYLGDLSGGQFIGRRVAEQFGFGPDGGASFYRFERIDDATAFRAAYRDRLDTIPWGPAEQQRVIDEVLVAYDLNTRLFADLGARHLTP